MVDSPSPGTPAEGRFASGLFVLEMEVKKRQTSSENIRLEVASLRQQQEALTAQIAQNEIVVRALSLAIDYLRAGAAAAPPNRLVTFIPCGVCESRETCRTTVTCLKMDYRRP